MIKTGLIKLQTSNLRR